MNNKLKIAVGVPTNRLIKPKTTKSLLEMIAYSVEKYDFYFIVSTKGYNTSENRNYIATQAVKNNCDYLLFIDDDMIFPSSILEQLLNYNKNIVGGIYNTKYEIQTPVIEYLNEERPQELFKCGAIGMGCLLIKCEVFKKIPQIWFNYIWNDNGSVKMSHDWYFCYKAREYGFDVFADPNLEIKHIGQKEY